MPVEMIVEDIPENNFQNKIIGRNKNQINYDDILKNMGMREVNGKLFWEKNQPINNENFVPYDPQQKKKKINKRQQTTNMRQSKPNTQQQTTNIETYNYQNSYIHNKYFKNEFKNQEEEMQKPRNLIEYRNMLIRRIIERKRIEQIKSRQMIFK